MNIGFMRQDGSTFFVGAKDVDQDYIGPVAEVYVQDPWLRITTDDYEGQVMLNIEALPFLQEALRLIAERIAQPK